ncbi:class II histocompatibility antigen, B-L beta chain-like [Acridotheres tristis]
MGKCECHFINGTEKVRFVLRHISNREQLAHFDSDMGLYVGDTPYGQQLARYRNSDPELLEYYRARVDTSCRYNYGLYAPFLVERRVPPSVSISLVPSNSQPGPGRLLCSVMDFYSAHIHEMVPGPAGAPGARGGHRRGRQRRMDPPAPGASGNHPWLGVNYTRQVEHVNLEQPLRQHFAETAAPSCGLGHIQDPLLRHHKDFGGVVCSPQPRCHSAPAGSLAAPSIPNKVSQIAAVPFIVGCQCAGCPAAVSPVPPARCPHVPAVSLDSACTLLGVAEDSHLLLALGTVAVSAR